ncbi:hypothetical protein Aperf_G00000018988 [Anoplocephala perfoliata]
MANNVKQEQIIGLINHPDNARPTFIQTNRTRFKRGSRIRFVEPKYDRTNCNSFRIFGEEARLIAERGKFDHLNAHCRESSDCGQALQNSSLRGLNSFCQNKSGQILTVLQPGLSASPLNGRSVSPCLRGEESLENYRRGQGSLSLQHLQQTQTNGVPSRGSQFSSRNEEFRANLWKDRYRRHSFLEHNSSSSSNRQDDFHPRVSEEGKAISLRGRGLTNDGISAVLNQGWSEHSGMRRAQSAVDIRPSKAPTPYSNVDSIFSLWNYKPGASEKRPQITGPHFYENSALVEQRGRQGVAAALDYSKNSTLERNPPAQRVYFEGIENAQKSRGSDLFGESKTSSSPLVARTRPESQEIAESGDGVKRLMTSSKNPEVLPPPMRRILSPGGRKIAIMSRGGAAKACLNPPSNKRLPMKAVRNYENYRY